MFQGVGKFLGTLLGSHGLLHASLNVVFEHAAHLRLFERGVGHGLLHLVNGLAQRVDNLSELLVA